MKVHTYLFVLMIACLPLAYAADEEPIRAARSVHFWYPAPEASLFYNEMTVEKSTTGSYFMACGFNHGYFGIQEIRSASDKVVIFSVWEPGNQDDPNATPEERRVKVLYEGEGVRVSRFGNEGTGGKSMFPYPWQIGETYRFLVKAKADGQWTAYTAYFFIPEENQWKRLATFQTLTQGDHLKGYYSFLEDFWRNGTSAQQIRRAHFGNGWVYSLDNHWIPLTRARFTADRTPTMNINAWLNQDRFYLQNGGDTVNETPLRTTLEYLPVDIDPGILDGLE